MLQSNQQCPICQKSCTKSDLTIHLKYCIEQLERSSNVIVGKKSSSESLLNSNARASEVSAATNRESRKTTIPVKKKKVPKSKMSFDINDDLDDFQNCENVVNRKRTLENSEAGDLLNEVNKENNERDNNSKQDDNNDGRNMRGGCEERKEEVYDTNILYQSNFESSGDVNRSNSTNLNLNMKCNEGKTSDSRMVGNYINHHQKHYYNNNHNEKDNNNGNNNYNVISGSTHHHNNNKLLNYNSYVNDNNNNNDSVNSNSYYNNNDSNNRNNNNCNDSNNNNENDNHNEISSYYKNNDNSEFESESRRYTNHSLNGRNNGNQRVRNVQHENYELSNKRDPGIVDLDSRNSIKKNKQFSDVSTYACPFIYITFLFFYINKI